MCIRHPLIQPAEPQAQLPRIGEAGALALAPAGAGPVVRLGRHRRHDLLAMGIAGLGIAALDPGFWSERGAGPGAPVAMGEP